jgi:NAD(P)-dependent dehydrogenase (short-subunit alcohol dehydrogenase family)
MNVPRLAGATVLVTGANGDLGVEFVHQALTRGAVRVYAATRTLRRWADPRVQSVLLDLNDATSVDTAVRLASDTTIAINSAGTTPKNLLSGGDLDEHRHVLEMNLWAPISLIRALAPIMSTNGGGTIVNVASAASWQHAASSYSVSKAALWAATNTLRSELLPSGVRIVGVHIGFVRSRMGAVALARMTPPLPALSEPADVVRETYDQLEDGAWEILADQRSRDVRANLSAPLEAMYPTLSPPASTPEDQADEGREHNANSSR